MRVSSAAIALFVLNATSIAALSITMPSGAKTKTSLLEMTSTDGLGVPSTETKAGTVIFFQPNKGYGFIEDDDGSGDIFVHQNGILKAGFRKLAKGERVEFSTAMDEKRGKLHAVKVVSERDAILDRAARSLLVARLEMEARERAHRESKKQAEAETEAAATAESSAAETPADGLLEEEARQNAAAETPRRPKMADEYGAMSLEERAYNILLDLGMIEETG